MKQMMAFFCRSAHKYGYVHPVIVNLRPWDGLIHDQHPLKGPLNNLSILNMSLKPTNILPAKISSMQIATRGACYT